MVMRAIGFRPSGTMRSPFHNANSNGGVPNIFNNLLTPRAAAEVASPSLGTSVPTVGSPGAEPLAVPARSADEVRLSSRAFTGTPSHVAVRPLLPPMLHKSAVTVRSGHFWAADRIAAVANNPIHVS